VLQVLLLQRQLLLTQVDAGEAYDSPALLA